jgi:hypothetical protein
MEKAEIIETPEKIENIAIIQRIINEVDDPNILSKTTITVLPESVDKVAKTEEKEEEKEVVSETEKKEEIKEPSKETLPKKEEERVELKPKEKDPVQRRIDEITKKRREAERESAFKSTKITELEEELKKAKSAIPQGEKPKLENFETEADYLEAFTDWKVEQKFRVETEKVSKEKASVEEKTAIDETYQELDEKMEKGRNKYTDFNELVLDENLKISDAMVEAILFSDTAEDVLYYLGKHPEEAEKISKLPSLKIAHEFGKIEAKLNAPPPKKRTTQAPEPITPVKTTGVTEKDPSDMAPREYRAWRERNKGG